jgi:GAF domain-containing protein
MNKINSEPNSSFRPSTANAQIDKQCFDPAKMGLLLKASRTLASTRNIDQLLKIIVEEVRHVLDCEGAGVLLYDEEKDDFYWRSIEDRDRKFASTSEEIRIPRDKGVCGWVFDSGRPALVHDAAHDPRLYRPVEDKSGFSTRNMICVPLQTAEKRLGVLYALNKIAGSFSEEDAEVMTALGGSVALALENAKYYEELKVSHKELERLNRVKDRTLHHLSHELKTPLAIIEATIKTLKRKLERADLPAQEPAFERLNRNLNRLKTIEKQVGHIVEERSAAERGIILSFLDYLPDFLEIIREELPELSTVTEALRKKVAGVFPTTAGEADIIDIQTAFKIARFTVEHSMPDRRLDVEFVKPDPAGLKINPHTFCAVLNGLVRNAVENTPDGGKVIVRGNRIDDGYKITVKDYGVGIPLSEQPNIFEGFYPIQETDLYSSGCRYAFNAGGTGTDLLKIKIFSQRFGFNVRFESQRCPHIPTMRDVCPGDVEKCGFCESLEDCLKSGGTEFVILIPPLLILNEPPPSGPLVSHSV